MPHFAQLKRHIPDLEERKILEIGAGRGDFLIEVAQERGNAIGIEINPAYIEEAFHKAKEAGVTIGVIKGNGERLPIEDCSFGFVNAAELIEHVEDPRQLFKEVYRVLAPEGCAYVSVPNRFGIKDPHFHLYFVNWLPRVWADTFIGIFGKHKDYASSKSGLQNLRDMHYYTFGSARRFFEQLGFDVLDIRVKRIRGEYPTLVVPILLALYRFLRVWYFDTFHLLLIKNARKHKNVR